LRPVMHHQKLSQSTRAFKETIIEKKQAFRRY
jgi:hypothetical protein